jgi:hypothetical protein
MNKLSDLLLSLCEFSMDRMAGVLGLLMPNLFGKLAFASFHYAQSQ